MPTPKKWPVGVSQQVVAAALANNCVVVKRRPAYVYAGFDEESERTAFKSAVSSIQNTSSSDIVHPDEPNLYFAKVVPT